jgi:hypothetical protein
MPVKLRIPDGWEGRIHSEDVRDWIQGYFQRPNSSLPHDPGAGNARVSLAIPRRAVKVLEGLTGDPPSVALRRVIAANVLALPASRYGMSVPPVPGRQEPRFASSMGDFGLDADAAEASNAEASSDAGISDLEFWLWVALAVVVVWAAVKFLDRGADGASLSASIAEDLPRFAEWLPKGGG